MSLKDDLVAEVNATFRTKWDTEATEDVPAPEDLKLNSNHAKHLEAATVLYADIDGSTTMVDTYPWFVAAEIYKAYLRCASQIIKGEGGTITAYDGDRVMGIFVGDSKNTSAARAAFKINTAVRQIINPGLKAVYTESNYAVEHVIGIDTSRLYAARIGVRGDNDIVWVGRAANYAAKLCTLSGTPIWVTADVYSALNDSTKIDIDGVNAWERRYWTAMSNMEVYRSSGWWTDIP